jgi:hypothetical protein
VEDKLQKANLISNALNGWGKILFFIISLIGGIYLTYYQIQTNSANIINNSQNIQAERIHTTREFEIWGTRSDKRYTRATKMADGINNRIDKIETRQIEIMEKLSYLTGKLEKYED